MWAEELQLGPRGEKTPKPQLLDVPKQWSCYKWGGGVDCAIPLKIWKKFVLLNKGKRSEKGGTSWSFHRIIELLMLEKTFKMKSSHQKVHS